MDIKQKIKDANCKCGHSRNLHTWSYAGGISKVENCKICFCKKFKKEQEK